MTNKCDCCKTNDTTRILIYNETDEQRERLCDNCRDFLELFLENTSTKWLEIFETEVNINEF